jgi:hypothetical protein
MGGHARHSERLVPKIARPGPGVRQPAGGATGRPERIFQLSGAARRRSSRRCGRWATRLPNNLPVQLSSFIGRERKVAEVRALVESYRLVTLTSYPGTVRQLIVTGLGRDTPTVIITNDRDTTTRNLIR